MSFVSNSYEPDLEIRSALVSSGTIAGPAHDDCVARPDRESSCCSDGLGSHTVAWGCSGAAGTGSGGVFYEIWVGFL